MRVNRNPKNLTIDMKKNPGTGSDLSTPTMNKMEEGGSPKASPTIPSYPPSPLPTSPGAAKLGQMEKGLTDAENNQRDTLKAREGARTAAGDNSPDFLKDLAHHNDSQWI
jgi:hypothetical protein